MLTVPLHFQIETEKQQYRQGNPLKTESNIDFTRRKDKKVMLPKQPKVPKCQT